MKNTVFLFFALVINLFGQTENGFTVNFKNLSNINKLQMFNDSVYVFGDIHPEDAELFINDQKIPVYKKGGFLAYIKLNITKEQNAEKYNKAIIKATLKKNNKSEDFIKTVYVKPPLKTLEFIGNPVINSLTIKPKVDYLSPEGTQIDIEFFGTPNCQAHFEVEGINKIFPMIETEFINNYFWGDGSFGKGFVNYGDTIQGHYKGSFFVTQNLKDSRIRVFLKFKKENKFIEVKDYAFGKISTVKKEDYQIGIVNKENNLVIGRSKPGMGYSLFLHDGIKLHIIGSVGNFYQAKIDDNKSIYVSKNSVTILPEGTPPIQNNIQIIRTEKKENFTEVQFGFFERVPVEIRQHNAPNSYELFFYNTSINVDWIRFDPNDTLVSEIKHYQITDDIMKVEILLNQKAHWGYISEYDGNIFKLKLKHAIKKQANILQGKRIVIDPGHNPESGASGPFGTVEKFVNHTLSLKLKEMLEKEGSLVFLTRPNVEDELDLRERRNKSVSYNPDIILSMHNNAVPQNMDATIYNGYSTYYYNPQAQKLAELINKEFSMRFNFRNHGLYCNNLYMCRITEAISVLVEPFFIIDPEQETFLNNDEYQNKVAESITVALKKYLAEYGE